MTKTMKLGLLALMVAVLALAVGSSSMAFHKADELKCMSCHTMHASENGSYAGVNPGNGFDAAPTGGVTSGGNPFLLVQPYETALCLGCHHKSGPASGFTDESGDGPPFVMTISGSPDYALPGGDYFSSTVADPGEGGRGHNPGTTDGTNWASVMPKDANMGNPLLPPGGSTPLIKWDCVSCHAPHYGDVSPTYGTASSFRMLWGKPSGQGLAEVAIDAVGGDLEAHESDTNHTAYRGLVSAWCGQCHGTFHSTAGNGRIHPSDEGLDSSSGIWNLYNSNPSPDTTAGYSYLVPVEDSRDTVNTPTTDFNVASTSLVMCLSCHRSHGAATHSSLDAKYRDARNITRWDMEQPSGPGTGCNKCHDKGE